MLRNVGMVLLIASVLLMGVSLVRFGSSRIASARDEHASAALGRQVAAAEVAQALSRTVKFLVVPAVLLLIGGALVGDERRDRREHQLRSGGKVNRV